MVHLSLIVLILREKVDALDKVQKSRIHVLIKIQIMLLNSRTIIKSSVKCKVQFDYIVQGCIFSRKIIS